MLLNLKFWLTYSLLYAVVFKRIRGCQCLMPGSSSFYNWLSKTSQQHLRIKDNWSVWVMRKTVFWNCPNRRQLVVYEDMARSGGEGRKLDESRSARPTVLETRQVKSFLEHSLSIPAKVSPNSWQQIWLYELLSFLSLHKCIQGLPDFSVIHSISKI